MHRETKPNKEALRRPQLIYGIIHPLASPILRTDLNIPLKFAVVL